MDIEQLKRVADKALDFATEHLRANREFYTMLHLVTRDAVEIILMMPDVTNSELAKHSLSGQIRGRISSGEIEAVILLADTYYCSNLTAEQEETKRRLKLNVEQAAAMGLCELKEALMVSLESPILMQVSRQFYKRTEAGIEFGGRETIDTAADESVRVSGLMGNWFAAQKTGRA